MSLIHTALYTTDRSRVNPTTGEGLIVVVEELVSKKRYALVGGNSGSLSLRNMLELREYTRNRFRGVYEVVGIIDTDSGAVFGSVPNKRLVKWDLVSFVE